MPTTGGGGEAEAAAAVFAVVMFVVCIGVVIGLAIAIVVCVLLYKCFNRVPAEHRKMEPGPVFLLLIPVFNIVWNFFVFLRLPESYQSYFEAQGRTDLGDCGKTVGLWYAICIACSVVPVVQYITGPASLVLLIIFLVKAWNLRGQIPESLMPQPDGDTASY